jgi:hypothetical protein
MGTAPCEVVVSIIIAFTVPGLLQGQGKLGSAHIAIFRRNVCNLRKTSAGNPMNTDIPQIVHKCFGREARNMHGQHKMNILKMLKGRFYKKEVQWC